MVFIIMVALNYDSESYTALNGICSVIYEQKTRNSKEIRGCTRPEKYESFIHLLACLTSYVKEYEGILV